MFPCPRAATSRFVALLAPALAAHACMGGDAEVVPVQQPQSTLDANVMPTDIPKHQLLRYDFDLNYDKRPDVFRYNRSIPDPARPGRFRLILVMKEVDVDFDGLVDFWRIYKDNGQIFRDYMDTDADGFIETITFYQDNIPVRRQYDLNKDGRPDAWKWLDPQGQMIAKETDSNNDGRPDKREEFQYGRLARIRFDRNFDGIYEDTREVRQ